MKVVSPIGALTDSDLREAERGFTLMLRRKRFSPAWIEENASDLLAQAGREYVEAITRGEHVRRPVGWLVNCAWRRAQNLLDTQGRKPHVSSIELAFHVADESTPTPEQQAVDNDRQERLREALGFLPDKDCKLLALVYFEDHSIREAGRKLGWQKSAADRHHSAALERLRALVGDDRSLLSPATLGLAAWVATNGEEHRPFLSALRAAMVPVREGIALGMEAATLGTQRLAQLVRKVSPLMEPSNAGALGGAGRAAGYCGVAATAVACGLAVGSVGPSVSPLTPQSDNVKKTPPTQNKAVAVPATPTEPGWRPASPAPGTTPQGLPQQPAPVMVKSADRAGASDRGKTSPARDTAQQAVSEFGLERESRSSAESSPAPTPTSPAEPSRRNATGGSSASPSPEPKVSGSSAGTSEFGL